MARRTALAAQSPMGVPAKAPVGEALLTRPVLAMVIFMVMVPPLPCPQLLTAGATADIPRCTSSRERDSLGAGPSEEEELLRDEDEEDFDLEEPPPGLPSRSSNSLVFDDLDRVGAVEALSELLEDDEPGLVDSEDELLFPLPPLLFRLLLLLLLLLLILPFFESSPLSSDEVPDEASDGLAPAGFVFAWAVCSAFSFSFSRASAWAFSVVLPFLESSSICF